MNIPAGFRKQLTNGQGDSNVFITLNKIESFHYLCILTQEHFQDLSSEPAQASGGPFKPDPKKMREFLEIMKEAQDCHYDEQGRLIIPKKFLEKAGIQGQVMIVGAREYIQLWDPGAFDRYLIDGVSSNAVSSNS
jgi:DNA-binding transcriptional regulator/RsmH inhibitor MraZ